MHFALLSSSYSFKIEKLYFMIDIKTLTIKINLLSQMSSWLSLNWQKITSLVENKQL